MNNISLGADFQVRSSSRFAEILIIADYLIVRKTLGLIAFESHLMALQHTIGFIDWALPDPKYISSQSLNFFWQKPFSKYTKNKYNTHKNKILAIPRLSTSPYSWYPFRIS